MQILKSRIPNDDPRSDPQPPKMNPRIQIPESRSPNQIPNPQSPKALLYRYYPTEQTESMSQNPEAKQKLHPIRPPPSLSHTFGPSPSVSRTVLLDRCRLMSLCIRLVSQSSNLLTRFLCASLRSLCRASSSSSKRSCSACVDCMSSCFWIKALSATSSLYLQYLALAPAPGSYQVAAEGLSRR